jgi:hypothetical protein
MIQLQKYSDDWATNRMEHSATGLFYAAPDVDPLLAELEQLRAEKADREAHYVSAVDQAKPIVEKAPLARQDDL